LGFDLDTEARKDCLGFAIQRKDHSEGEEYWLKGMKTFEATDPGLGPGGQVSSQDHPFQSFQWGDYTAKPDHKYTYTIVPRYGTPIHLTDKNKVSLTITTEKEYGKPHSVFFNRGAAASQEYARRFQNISPDELYGKQKESAYRWLSRGLLEALIEFIGRANSDRYGLYGAVYEFQWAEALKAIKAAAEDKHAEVCVIYDAIPGATNPVNKNEDAIARVLGSQYCKPRTLGKIMHNKFFVLTKDGIPIAVWTGSTNLTENGIYGHSNCGHIIEDPDIAKAYLDYWTELKDCTDRKDEKNWMAQYNPNPPDPWKDNLRAVFSPRKGLEVLKWYSQIAAGDLPLPSLKTRPLFMTFAFGMHDFFKKIYEQDDHVLRFALMEKEGNGAGLAQGIKDIKRIRNLPNVVVAVGNNIVANSFDRWLKERQQLTTEANVRFIHTKFMLVDPLSEQPVVVTGSANFSEASTNANNENMVVIRNDTRVADIYLGEFLRLHRHYAFREALVDAQKKGINPTNWRPKYLKPDEHWQDNYYEAGLQNSLRRCYFAGN